MTQVPGKPASPARITPATRKRDGKALSQRDLFQLDSPLYGEIRGERSLMAFPFFALSKNAWMKPLSYEHATVSIEVRPSANGVATIYDKEIVLYIASLMAAKLEAGEDVAQDFIFTAHDLFSVTGSNHSARSYQRLSEALERLRRVARRGERVLSASERLVTQLSAGAVRVLEELLTLAQLNQGRVYPSYDHLARVTGLGRATVARGLRLLEEIGFLVRQRRFARLHIEGAGPQIAQTSNAYRLTLPRGIAAHLPRWMRPAPLADDEAQRLTTRDAEQQAMRRSLSCRELALATLDGPLGRMLAKLGAGIDARDAAGLTPNASLTLIRNPSLNHLSSAERYGTKQTVEPRLDQPLKR